MKFERRKKIHSERTIIPAADGWFMVHFYAPEDVAKAADESELEEFRTPVLAWHIVVDTFANSEAEAEYALPGCPMVLPITADLDMMDGTYLLLSPAGEYTSQHDECRMTAERARKWWFENGQH